MHPVIAEMNRCHTLGNVQSTSFRRWQRVLRDEVQPLLDERERLIEENHELREKAAAYDRLVASAPPAADVAAAFEEHRDTVGKLSKRSAKQAVTA